MFSKLSSRTIISVSLLLTLLFQTGCDRFLKGRGNDEKAETIEIKAPELECLKATPAELQKFFDDEGNAETLNQSVTCVQKALKAFQRLTKGSQPDSYLSKELQYFFNTFLLKENKISDSFQKEIMKVKVAVVGGSADVVTKVELNQFSEFLDKAKSPLNQLRGRMRVLLFKQDKNKIEANQIESVQADLKNLVEFVLKNTKLADSRYQWLDLVSFLSELNQFMASSKALTPFLKYVPLANSIKVLFFGESAKLVSQTDWEIASKWLLKLYGAAAHFHYQVSEKSLEDPAKSEALIYGIDLIAETIQTAPVMKERKVLEATSLDQVIDETYKMLREPPTISAVLLKSTYRKALIHFIEAQMGRGDEQSVTGLTENHIRIILQEYNIWKLSQKFLIETYKAHPSLGLQNLRWYVTRFPIEGQIDSHFLQQEEVKRSWVDYQKLLALQPGVNHTAQKKIRISPNSHIEAVTFGAASEFNLLRTYTRLAHRGYGDPNAKSAFDRALTRQGLTNLEEDFREFGRAVKFLDPRVTNAGSRTFDQGNFFSYHGNGDDRLHSTETFEVLAQLVSGGGRQLDEFYQDLVQQNCLLPELDVFQKNFVDEECFKRALRQKYTLYFNHLPGMVQFFGTLNDQQWASTYQGLIAVAKAPGRVAGRIESSEIRTLSTVLNFIETLMVVYDRDQNGRLSEAEVVAASPRFQNFIAKISPLRDFLVEDIFIFLVFEGRKPGPLDMVTFVPKRKLGFSLGEVGKYNLIQLLGVLNNESK